MLALQALCVYEALGDAFTQRLSDFLSDAQVHEDLEFDAPPPSDVLAFARTLAQSAWSRHDQIDAALDSTAAHWSVVRMTPVDRNVLRLGLLELLEFPETPPQVVINEAIELARRFGDADSASFVNGVLDAAWRKDQPAASPTETESAQHPDGSAG